MPLYTNPFIKRKTIRDDSVTPPQAVQKVLAQTGKIKSVARDASRSALPPGKRISRTGRTYYEGRKNRSDLPGGNF